MSSIATPGVEPARPSRRWVPWLGRGLSALLVLLMLFSGIMKVTQQPPVVEAWGTFGYQPGSMVIIGVIEIACALIYAIPRTAVLGAILLTGYLGGAIATHVRIADVFVGPLLLGVVAWAGLYLRDERVRRLIPLRAAS